MNPRNSINPRNPINSRNTRNLRNSINPRNPRNPRNSRNALCCLLFALCSMLYALSLEAKVTGNCSNCHTMHNSRNGQPVARGDQPWGGIGGSTESRPNLLIASCLGCHSSILANEGIKEIGGSKIPIVYNTTGVNYGDSQPDGYKVGLAGGNFYYLNSGGANPGTISSQLRGHSVTGIWQTGGDVTGWPGTYSPGCGDCHEKAKLETYGCKSCHVPAHHKGDSPALGAPGLWADADDGYYRFLGPVPGHEYGVRGYEDIDWQKNSGSSDHNEYSGEEPPGGGYHSISRHCIGCHNYNVSLDCPWGHVATLVLPWTSIKYRGYVGYWEKAPPLEVDYDPKLPIARANILNGSWPGGKVNYNSTDALMCLTCHRAHASPYDKMLRWNNTLVLCNQCVPSDPCKCYYGCLGCHNPDPL